MIKSRSLKVAFISGLAMIMLLWGMYFNSEPAFAEPGNVSSCTISRYYQHPVSGVIEDSGGEGSFATGQGMVEGCVNSFGMLEETDGGRYLLTIRLSLSDFTSGISFSTQNWGASGWTPAAAWESQYGSDSQGTTTDYCIPVPSENCIVRGTMFVEPMGRDVIFYLAPSGYTAGNSVGMLPQYVDVPSEKGNTEPAEKPAETEEPADDKEEVTEKKEEQKSVNEIIKAIDNIGEVTSESEKEIKAARDAFNALSDEDKKKVTNEDKLIEAEKKLAEIKTAEIEMPSTESTLNAATGISLSTAKDVEAEADSEEGSMGRTIGIVLAVLAVSGAAAGGVYYVKKNKERAGDTRDDDE